MTGPPRSPAIRSTSCSTADPTDALGHGGLRDANLWTSPDLNAAFSVGYDPKEQLIYLAVTVRDDELVVGHASHLDTDAVEVYVNGTFSDRQHPFPATAKEYQELDPAKVPSLQYVAIPGRGMIYGVRQASNPILIHGTAKETRTRMVYSRRGDVTIYESGHPGLRPVSRQAHPARAGQADRLRRRRGRQGCARIDAGRFPGPRNDRSRWIYWGPFWRGSKTLDSGARRIDPRPMIASVCGVRRAEGTGRSPVIEPRPGFRSGFSTAHRRSAVPP